MYVFSQGQARASQSRTDESFLIVFRERTVTAFCFCLSQTFCWRWNTPWKFCSDDAPLVCVPFSQGVCMANKWISTTNPRFKCMITNHLHQITCLAEKRNKYRKGKLQLQEESHNKFAQLRFNALISVFFSSAVLFIFFWKGSWKERWKKSCATWIPRGSRKRENKSHNDHKRQHHAKTDQKKLTLSASPSQFICCPGIWREQNIKSVN